MIYHVLPGDASVKEFQETGIAGEVIVCREVFIVGPIDAKTPEEFWDARAKFILSEYSEDEIVYHEKVADELERLAEMTLDDEVNLWFEYELFCSVNMWFCLDRLAESGAKIYRVEPAVLETANRWSGFGQLNVEQFKSCFDVRQLFTDADVKLGRNLWDAFADRDGAKLMEFAETATPRFPYLSEVAKAAAEIETRPYDVLREIKSDGFTEFEKIFPEFAKRAGVYGFGDSQVQRILDSL